jgi:hypothetical protein
MYSAWRNATFVATGIDGLFLHGVKSLKITKYICVVFVDVIDEAYLGLVASPQRNTLEQ